MEVHFTPEQEALLSQVASHKGTEPEQLVNDAALRLLERDARFRDKVREGMQQADRGELIEEEEMEARIARMLEP
ncbi:MAG: hypothetical protein ACRD3B_03100 [Candidatus Sulfotelmatobacter sp.]